MIELRVQGLTADSTILDVSDVELVDLKFVESNPVVVVQFNCQQINCARDKFGNIVEGSPQHVQRVYYYWALQQGDAGLSSVDNHQQKPLCNIFIMLRSHVQTQAATEKRSAHLLLKFWHHSPVRN